MQHNVTGSRPLTIILLLAIGLLIPALARPALASSTSENTADIVFTDDNGKGAALAPNYPSTINVSGLDGSITRLTVTLSDIDYNFWDNLDVLLVGPDGTHVLLMSDIGGSTNSSAAPLTLTFDDAAASALPDGSSPAITSGSFRPTNFQATSASDTFPAPAPNPPSFNTSLGQFKLTDPNGTWRLFAVEDDTGSSGSIGAWSLTFETADLALEVGAAASVNAGSTLTYSVTARNRGTEAVAAPALSIAIPASTTFSAVTPAGGWSCPAPAAGAPIACTIGSFASGAVATFSVSVTVDKALAPGTTITRAATITSSVAEANTANNSASGTTSVTTLADLEIVAVDSPAEINAGARMTVAVSARNNGPSNAAGAVVVIAVPARTTFASVTKPDGWACAERPAQPSGTEVACTRAVFATGDAAFSLSVDVDADLPPTAPGVGIVAGASVDSATDDDDPGNNSKTDGTVVAALTDLAVAVADSPDPVSSAAELTYTIVVTNNGPSNAAGAALTTAVQLGTAFVSLSAPDGWTCATKPAVGGRGAVGCSNPSFGVDSATFTLKVRVLSGVSEGETLSLTAGVASSTADSDGTNDSDTEETGVTIAADLSVALDGVGPAVKSGAAIAYNIRVNNSGPEVAEGVSVTSATPANTTFVSLTAPAGWTCGTKPAAGGTGAIVCTNPGLDVKTDTLVLTVRVDNVANGTPVALSAAVATSANTDKNPANDSATLSSTVAIAADMGVTVGGPTGDARPGDALRYTIVVRNAGPESALGATVSIPAVANTTFVSLAAPAGWSCTTPAAGAGGPIACANPSFGVTSASFSLALRADGVTENTAVTVRASVAASSQDLVAANNSASLTTPLIARYRAHLPLVRR